MAITPSVLSIVAGLGAAFSMAMAARHYSHGVWAAGYWWSVRDRERGPGC
jgi:hypothetical protein